MNSFKDPQPRKVPVDNNMFSREGAEPYPRTPPGTFPAPGELRIPKPADTEPKPPARDTPSSLDVTVRKAALEAACALQGNGSNAMFWGNIEALETYLREGKTP